MVPNMASKLLMLESNQLGSLSRNSGFFLRILFQPVSLVVLHREGLCS